MTQRQNQSDTLNNNQEYEDINFISAILNNEEEEEEEKISSEYLGEKCKTSLYYIVLSFSIIVLVVFSIYIYFSAIQSRIRQKFFQTRKKGRYLRICLLCLPDKSGFV